MNTNSRVTLRWPAVAGAVIALLAVGAGTTYLVMQRSSSDQPVQNIACSANAASTGRTSQPGNDGSLPSAKRLPLPDVVVTISVEAMKRAGIELVAVARGASGPSAAVR